MPRWGPNLAGIRTIGQRGVDEEVANWGRAEDSIPAICYGRSARVIERMYLLIASFESVSGERLEYVAFH